MFDIIALILYTYLYTYVYRYAKQIKEIYQIHKYKFF